MKKFLLPLFLLLFLSVGVCSCRQQANETIKVYPMFWTWLDYRPGMNFDSICGVMNELGMEGVLLNAPTPDDYRVAIPIAHKHDIEVYAWLWTMNLEHDRDRILKEHPEWFSVNRNGKSLADTTAYVDYYKFLCPALPEVREFIKDKIKSYCEVEGLNGIAIDYHRFVDVVLPTTLWPHYDIVQDREYAAWDYGYHPAMLEKFKEQYGYDPREQKDPSLDMNWRQFRCDQITEVANMIAGVVHSYGKMMAASPFPTPKMASRMVRQDWGKWDLDIVFPMVYHTFYTEDVSFISDCTVENVRDKNKRTILYCGMMAIDGPEMFECMDAALDNGAQGISVFTINGLRSPEIRKQFKTYTDSVKAVRTTNGRLIKVSHPAVADADPFKHEGVMKRVERRMQQIIAGTAGEEGLVPLALGEYRLNDYYDATRHYQVVDNNSGTAFDVTFYFYGDVLSGWDVTKARQESKQLCIKKIRCSATPEADMVPSLLDKNNIEFHPIDVVNWKDFPYKPEVSFRIAHTGKCILLHYKVKEESVRAMATGDNGQVWEDACVEFFVSPMSDSCYYNLECNCIGKLLIQGGPLNNRPLASKQILNAVKRWSSLGNRSFEERVGECDWELALVIPISIFFLHSLDTLDGKTMRGNFYKCGDKLQTPHYLSWSSIGLERPMFHCPDYFGTLFFE